MGVIDDIADGTMGVYSGITREIKHRRQAFLDCCVYQSRSSNTEVHNLAKSALSLGVGRHLWLGSPYDPNAVPVNILVVE